MKSPGTAGNELTWSPENQGSASQSARARRFLCQAGRGVTRAWPHCI